MVWPFLEQSEGAAVMAEEEAVEEDREAFGLLVEVCHGWKPAAGQAVRLFGVIDVAYGSSREMLVAKNAPRNEKDVANCWKHLQ